MLYPLFEAIVNSIQSIHEKYGEKAKEKYLFLSNEIKVNLHFLTPKAISPSKTFGLLIME